MEIKLEDMKEYDIDTSGCSSWPSDVTEISDFQSNVSELDTTADDFNRNRQQQDVSFHFKVVTCLLVPLICCCLLCCVFCAQSRDWLRGCLGLQYVYRETYPPQPDETQTEPFIKEKKPEMSSDEACTEHMQQPQLEFIASNSYGSMNSSTNDIVTMEVKDQC